MSAVWRCRDFARRPGRAPLARRKSQAPTTAPAIKRTGIQSSACQASTAISRAAPPAHHATRIDAAHERLGEAGGAVNARDANALTDGESSR